MIIITNLLEMIDETPLIALSSFLAELSGITLLAKAEFINPSGSVGDCAARTVVLDGITRGLLTPDKTIIDATSDNTRIAYTMIGVALGCHVRLYLSQNTSPERKKMIRQYGAMVVETDPLEGSDGTYLEIQAQVAAYPEHYFYPDRYNSPVNPQTHSVTTGKEIWE